MASADFKEIKGFKVFFGAHPYEVHFGRNGEGYFYEIEDMESLSTVAAEDGLSRDGVIRAVGCALEPYQFVEFEQLLFSIT